MTASKLEANSGAYTLLRGKIFDLIRFLRRLCCLWTGLCGVHAQYLQINRCTIPLRLSEAWQKAQISINLRSSPPHLSPFLSTVLLVNSGIWATTSFFSNCQLVFCLRICLTGWQRPFVSALRPTTFDSTITTQGCDRELMYTRFTPSRP